MRRRTGRAVLGSALLALAPAGAADATIQAFATTASLRIPASDAPVIVGQGGPFSFFMWLRRTGFGLDQMHVLHLDGQFELLADPVARCLAARLHDGSGGSLQVDLPLVDSSGQLPINQWILIGLSWDPATGNLEGWARGQDAAQVHEAAVSPGFAPNPTTGELTLGRPDLPGAAAQPGVYGLIVFRNHVIGADDFQAVWDDRDYLGPYRLENVASGGAMTGTAGTVWMANHAILTNPLDGVIPGTAGAALPSTPVEVNNYCVYAAHLPQSSFFAAGNVAAVSSGGSSFIYLSPFEVASPPFFVRKLPAAQLPDPPYVPAVAPKTRQVALAQPQSLLRCVVSGNSRATKISDADERTYPENHGHGFVGARLGYTAGILNRPARLSSGVRWFGLDTTNGPSWSGTIAHLYDPGAHRNFARFWSNSSSALVGPGEGLFMDEGATFALKCRPEPASLLMAEAPVVIRTYLMKFPGAGTASWQPVQAGAQNQQGALGAATQVSLDSATVTRVLTANDAFDFANLRITFDADLPVSVGEACYVADGTAAGGISVISAVEHAGGTTTVTVERWFVFTPAVGATLKFGPWAIVPIEYEWPALAPGDPNIWRGLKLTATGGPLVNFAWDAWRPGVNGFVFGRAGWGAHGYTPQVEEAFSGAVAAWMQALEPEVWFQTFAQQESAPSSMADFLAVIRDALPGIEVTWMGDGEHISTFFGPWHEYILAEAANNGVSATSVLLDTEIGSILDQAVDGLRADANHWSYRGNSRLAGRWLEHLLVAALPSPDIDGDGEVGINDFLILLGTWGPCPPAPDPCPADLNLDGEVGIEDFLAVLGNWG